MAGKSLAIRLLGPVDARLGEIPLQLGSRQQRLILSVLALEPGVIVPLERLLGLLWPPSATGFLSAAGAPRTARASIQVAISRLQAVLAEHASIVGDGSGYRLDLTDAWTDVAAFHLLTEQARESADAIAARLLTEADALWRGPALADVAGPEERERLCHGLQESRLVATEDRFEALLRLGRHEQILPELATAVAADPLRERLVGQRMVALHRAGDSPAALALYRQTAGRLSRQLGLQPGPRLEELRDQIATDSPELAVPAVRGSFEAAPSELPPPGPDLLDRPEPMRALEAAAGTPGASIAVLTGPGGIGKTQLALQWAHRHRHEFPAGQLYIDLRGRSLGRAQRPVDVLAQFLRALGTGIRQIPSDPDAAAAAFRAAVRGRRLLVVLDNAAGVDQLDLLLPADPHCFTLITSREPLQRLVRRERAQAVPVPALAPEASLQLLGSESPDVLAVAERCGHIPIAVRTAAAQLRIHDLAPAGLLPDLPEPGHEADRVRAVAAAAYRRLGARDQRVFRLLGVVPGADIGLDAVAALTRLPPAQAAESLRALVALQLVTAGTEGRFGLHDLMHGYAADLAAVDAEAEAARSRLAQWYETATAAATGLLFPQHRVMLPGAMPVESGRFTDNAAAMQWLEREFGNLVALITASAQNGPRPASWRLAAALSPYLRTDIPAAPIRLIAAAAASAAQVVEDLPGQAVANMTLAAAAKLDNEHEVTERHLRRARQLALRAGWVPGEATALRLLGNLYSNQQRVRAAVRCCEESLDVFQRLGDLGGQAINLHNSGMMYFLLGDLPHARERADQALRHYESIGSLSGAAKACAALAQVELREGRIEQARERAGIGCELARRSEDLRAREAALATLAEVQHTAGAHTEAEKTLELARSTGTNNPYTAIIAGQISAGIAYAREDFGRAVAEAEDALAVATRLNAASFANQLQLRRGAGLLRIGRPEEALTAVREGIDTALEHEFEILHALGLIELAWIELAEGEAEAATASAQRALQLLRTLGDRLGEPHALAVLAAARARAGDPAGAERHRAGATAAFTEMGIPVQLRGLDAVRAAG